ncbi:MAG: hypothetical protein HY070_06095 [Chloroflexi bacterium]|nr:hypothetical protein [Chloroflexota bacterium]
MTLPLAWKKSSVAINLWEKIARSSAQRDPENNSTSNLWNNLQTTIDLVHWKPAPAAGILARELRERNGTYYVLKNPRARTYLRLLPREYWLWQKLDGKQSVQDLVVAYFLEYGTFAFGLVAGLVQQLRAKEMLSEQPQSVFGSVQLALNDQRARGKLTRPLRALLSAEWAIARLDRLIGALYRWIGGLIYSRPAQIIFFATSVIGLGAYLRIVSDDNYRFLATTDLRINIAVLWLLTIVPVIIHELGHALTTKHFGREVYRGGLMLYLGIPAAFVDTTDIWMEPKRARLAVTWAGPYSGFILAGSCAIIIWFAPALNIAPILFQLATIGLALSILNLNPALNLDGYHLLSDAVEIPRLQERAFAFLRHNFISKFFRRERLTRDEIIYVLFGALLGLWTLYVLFVTVVVWRARAVESIAVALAALDRNSILLIRAVILLLVLAFLILARARIGSFITRVTDLIRRYRIFSGRRRAALGIALGALILASASELLAPEAAELFEFVLGVGAILASAYLAFLVARELRGGIYARAFGVFATALAAMSVANILLWLPMTLTDAFAIAFDFIALVLIGIAYAMLARLFGGLGSSWRAISIWFLVAGWLIFFLAFFISTFAQVTLHLLAGLLFLGGMLHWHAANLQPLAVEQISLADQSARAALFAAFTGLVENILRQTNAAYGRHVRARVESEFDRRALAKGWEIRFGNRSEDLFSAASSYRRLPASDLGEIFAASLDALLKALARLAGDFFARRVLARAYDALDWDLREIASEYIFPHVASASALSQEFQQHRGDLIALLQRAPLFKSKRLPRACARNRSRGIKRLFGKAIPAINFILCAAGASRFHSAMPRAWNNRWKNSSRAIILASARC